MASHLRWGILATGRIAHQFAGGLKVSKTGTLTAVGSRSMEAARAFCDQHGGKPYPSYDEVLADPEVEAVYIATPHHMHADWTIKTAQAGKAVLCEKPFTLNPADTKRAIDACQENNVFFMEAFMYRCHPQTRKIKQLVDEGAVGQVKMISAEFGFNSSPDWDNFRLDGSVGGGALMDVGTYCVSMSRLIAGEEPSRAEYVAAMTERGYDQTGSGMLGFPSGINAHFGTAIHQHLENHVRIYGTTGMIDVDAPWKCYESGVLRIVRDGKVDQDWRLGTDNDHLYAFEADAVAEFFEAKQCPHMTIADTLGQARALALLRESAHMPPLDS